jgi:hypothetical protein
VSTEQEYDAAADMMDDPGDPRATTNRPGPYPGPTYMSVPQSMSLPSPVTTGPPGHHQIQAQVSALQAQIPQTMLQLPQTHQAAQSQAPGSIADKAPVANVSPTVARAFVKRIIKYQHSNGAFVFPNDAELKTVLGPAFYTTVKNSMPSNVPEPIAVTALLVALLEAQFESCRGLWVLVVEKARGFVMSNVEGVDPEKVFADAQWAVAGMEMLDMEEDVTVRVGRDSEEGVELLFAPVV